MRVWVSILVSIAILVVASFAISYETSSTVINTQEETIPLLTPQQALSELKLPDGFTATLFASEPQVRQPIAMTFDSRGRMWVAENDTYSDRSTNYDLNQKDRVVIFDDENGDGEADSRKVFWDQGHHLTSVEVGFGGVWVLCAPDLLFIPDRNRDDVPDEEPTVILTGFNNDEVRHNIVNGLKWGPDGWLYGRHGITTTSFVGTPESPEELRIPVNCSIWRFHPQTEAFEVVCRGTTNPWGHDWDENGELFFINTVIGHLWHAIPGAHFERMFGQDFNPHLYRLMPQAADHFHWDTTEKWSDIRSKGQVVMSDSSDSAGGGHAHSGFMIYQGTNWPKEYRGDAFTLNFHGRRINRDSLDRNGAGYTGRHKADFAQSGDQWFRGVEISQGPDSGVYILDWSDIGECHENDGIHRTSGRIFKVTHNETEKLAAGDLRDLNNKQLLGKLLTENAWDHRIARRIFQERFVAGNDLSELRSMLQKIVENETDIRFRLRALWTLLSTGGVSDQILANISSDSNEHLRVWWLRTLQERSLNDSKSLGDQIPDLIESAKNEDSGLVLLYYASLLQRMELSDRLALGEILLQKETFANDPHLPLMVWYGIESAVGESPLEAVSLLKQCQMAEIQSFIARRIANEHKKQPEALVALVDFATSASNETTTQILAGAKDAFEGLRKATPPENWQSVSEQLAARNDNRIAQLVRELSVTFGDGRAVAELRRIVQDKAAAHSVRSNAIRSLVTAKDVESRKLLEDLVSDRDLGAEAIRGLAIVGDERTPHLLVKKYESLRGHVQPVAMETLASRPDFAVVLLKAVDEDLISASDIPSFYLRQMRVFDDPQLQKLLQKHLPEWRHTSQEKEERVNELRGLLTTARLEAANENRGREIFEKTCASCHKFYGRGGNLGPDITGSQRSNLNYLLGNIVDPSAEVAEKYRMSILALSDGRVISGVVLEEADDLIRIQTPNETLTILRDDVEARKNSTLSMMPERQLDQMTNEQIADLFAYLMSTSQVALPKPSN